MRSGMLRLRVTVVLLLLWLATLYNVERLHKPINLASFVYVLTGLMAAAIILSPKLRKTTLVEISFVALPLYALIKSYLGYQFFGAHLPITVTECVVIFITNGLAWAVAHQIDLFMLNASDLAAIQGFKTVSALADGESKMYGEVQRARRFQRNLAVATVSMTSEFHAEELDRLTHHARLEIARRYLESRVAQRLSESVSPGDLVVHHDGAFILMFPEATEESVRPLLQKVLEELHEQLGVRLQVGIAQFPDEECTLTGLIERAEVESHSMKWQEDAKVPSRVEEPTPLAFHVREHEPETA